MDMFYFDTIPDRRKLHSNIKSFCEYDGVISLNFLLHSIYLRNDCYIFSVYEEIGAH